MAIPFPVHDVRSQTAAHAAAHVPPTTLTVRLVSPSTDSDMSEREINEEGRSLASEDIDTGGVPKPPGEVAHPGRGGYTLKTALAWDEQIYKRFLVSVRQLFPGVGPSSHVYTSESFNVWLGSAWMKPSHTASKAWLRSVVLR